VPAFVLDMATAVVPRGRLEVAARRSRHRDSCRGRERAPCLRALQGPRRQPGSRGRAGPRGPRGALPRRPAVRRSALSLELLGRKPAVEDQSAPGCELGFRRGQV
jgi:hypothetical protein